jgi:hypothetical protein
MAISNAACGPFGSPDAGIPSNPDSGTASTVDAGPSRTPDAGPAESPDSGLVNDGGPSGTPDAGLAGTPDSGFERDAGQTAGYVCGGPPGTTAGCDDSQFCEMECNHNFATCLTPPSSCGATATCDCVLDGGPVCNTIPGAQPFPPACIEDGGHVFINCSQSC